MTGGPQYAWRLDLDDEAYAHLVILGQTPRPYGNRRWVWSACGRKADARQGAEHDTARCQDCRAWQAGRTQREVI